MRVVRATNLNAADHSIPRQIFQKMLCQDRIRAKIYLWWWPKKKTRAFHLILFLRQDFYLIYIFWVLEKMIYHNISEKVVCFSKNTFCKLCKMCMVCDHGLDYQSPKLLCDSELTKYYYNISLLTLSRLGYFAVSINGSGFWQTPSF